MEIPTITNPDAVIEKEFYILQYNEKYEQVDWVVYELTKEEVLVLVKRKDTIKSDPSITTGSAKPEDYKGCGYDRSHLAPEADMKISTSSMSDSFYISYMSPQHPSLNRGGWSKLESYVRTSAYENEIIYIITGPVLTKDEYPAIGENEVAIPEFYYKVILDNTGDEVKVKVIGFILPNEEASYPPESYEVNIDEVESFTDIDFFPSLPDKDEDLLESFIDLSQWTFKTFNAPQIQEELIVLKDIYWINISTMTRHNSSYKYYEHTKKGYLTTDAMKEKLVLYAKDDLANQLEFLPLFLHYFVFVNLI